MEANPVPILVHRCRGGLSCVHSQLGAAMVPLEVPLP